MFKFLFKWLNQNIFCGHNDGENLIHYLEYDSSCDWFCKSCKKKL